MTCPKRPYGGYRDPSSDAAAVATAAIASIDPELVAMLARREAAIAATAIATVASLASPIAPAGATAGLAIDRECPSTRAHRYYIIVILLFGYVIWGHSVIILSQSGSPEGNYGRPKVVFPAEESYRCISR